MASTKITEFDLDPNMDMAHESTVQEILDTVNNMETSLTGELTANVVKSIQHVSLSYSNTTDVGEIPINPVNLEKTIFLMYRQYDYGGCSNIVYTTTQDKISLDLPTSHGRVAFWIIEFY